MRNLVSTYVDQFRQDRQKQLKLAAVLAALAVIVAGIVFWQLHSTGVAMTNEVFCGQEEHIHTEDCYDGEVLTCEIPEHIHTVECLMDETADVETADVWEATLPELTDVWADDVVAIAESQIGYNESTTNFVLADDGETHMGYTRYGAWYGNAYGDWDAMFASFCLNYANVPASVVAENSGAYALAVSLNEQGLYIDAADFTPAAGDLVFFDENNDEVADRVGIIVNVGEKELAVIEGNSEDAVAENTYDMNDAGILAFGILPDQGTPDGTETVDGDIVYAANDGGVYVSVTAPADALPEGTELSVTLIDEDSTDYVEAADVIGLNVQTLSSDEEEAGMAVLDICFLLDGREVEPAEPVTVSIDAGAILPDGAENIMIQHLEETNEGVVPVLMAELNAASPVAEFEVESFSPFTVTWTISGGGPAAGTTYSVNVTAYLDNQELDITTGLTFDSENDELDFETLLSDVNYGTGDYTFSYAIVTVGNQTYGSQENPVIAIEIDQGTGGPTASSNFLLVYADGTTGTVSTSSTVSVSAYYLTPDFSVSIEAVDEDESTEAWALQAVLAHAGSYESISYEWTVTDGDGNTSQYASVTNTDNTGRAYIAWASDTPDNTEVTVSVTVTLTTSDGETKTATADYVLEYGDETVDLIMTYGPDKTALPAGVTVTLTSESGEHVYTGTTDSDGWVHDLEIEPGMYIVYATYTDDDGNTYQINEEVAFPDAGNYYLNLNYYDPTILTDVPERSNWEHIDIKLSVGTTSNSSSGSVSVNITGAQIIGSDGTVKYTATAESIEGNDNEFQLIFYPGTDTTGTADHSVEFDTSDTITITYVLTIDGVEQSPITITITSSTVYDEGTTYPATGQRAYKLYNYLYGTSYSSDAQLIADGIEDIDISGMSMMLVAAILCDSSEVTGAGQVQAVDGQSANQWGMDFALSIEAMNQLADSWAFNIEKTYENASMTAGDFVFYLYSATVADGTWTLGELQSTLTNQTAGMELDGNSYDTMEAFSIAYSDEAIQAGETYYYILYEKPDTVTSESGATITFDGTIFGVMVQLGTEVNDDGETVSTVTATYYRMEKNDNGTYIIADTYTTGTSVDGKITFDADEYATFEFTNNYQNYTEISGIKQWDDYNDFYGLRPESITIYLLVNGVQALDENGEPITAVVTSEDNWSWSFTDLPMYDGTTQYVYSIEEVSVPGYVTTVDDDGNLINRLDFDRYPVILFKYTDEAVWTSTTATEGNSEATDTYYLRYTDAAGNQYYAIVEDDGATGTSVEDPLVVTGWSTDQNSAWSVSVAANAGATYYFTGQMGNESVYFETEDGPNGDTESIELVEGVTRRCGLEGAEFTLSYVDEEDGTKYYAYFEYVEASDESGYTFDTYVFIGWQPYVDYGNYGDYYVTLTSGSDGYIHIDGLSAGTYTLTETRAPDGYAKLTSPLSFTVSSDGIEFNGVNVDEIDIENEESTYRVDIFKYAGGNSFTGTYTSSESETYYLIRTNNETGDKEYMASCSASDDGLVYSGFTWTSDPSDAENFTCGVGTLTFIGLDSGYTYHLTDDIDDNDGNQKYLVMSAGVVAVLPDAEFVIQNYEGLYASFEYDDATGIYTVADWVDEISDATTLTSGNDGYIHVEGLEIGTYTLIETKAPDGYYMIGSIDFTLESDGSVIAVTLTPDGAIAVLNETSTQLPNTGGIGIWIYTVIGLLLIGGAASLFVYRKRRAV